MSQWLHFLVSHTRWQSDISVQTRWRWSKEGLQVVICCYRLCSISAHAHPLAPALLSFCLQPKDSWVWFDERRLELETLSILKWVSEQMSAQAPLAFVGLNTTARELLKSSCKRFHVKTWIQKRHGVNLNSSDNFTADAGERRFPLATSPWLWSLWLRLSTSLQNDWLQAQSETNEEVTPDA